MVRPVAEHSEAPSPQPRFEFDRRPLGWVVLSRLKRQVLLLGLFSAFLWIRSMTPPEGLDETAWSALTIFSLCGAPVGYGGAPSCRDQLIGDGVDPDVRGHERG